jgi:trehalose/maltose hydrolase-like predicted phosphorylase
MGRISGKDVAELLRQGEVVLKPGSSSVISRGYHAVLRLASQRLDRFGLVTNIQSYLLQALTSSRVPAHYPSLFNLFSTVIKTAQGVECPYQTLVIAPERPQQWTAFYRIEGLCE